MRWLILAAFSLTGCPKVCEMAQTRCEKDAVQICSSRGRWRQVFDCQQVLTRDGKMHKGTCVAPGRCGIATSQPASQPAGR